jgi:hypothetical protein
MGWTVLYIAFGIVALWLLGEVLLQYKARLRWRLLAFVGFLGVVLGVLMPSVVVIGVGASAFAIGQTFVTLSFRRGFTRGWAVRGFPGVSRWRDEDDELPESSEPTLEVSDLEAVSAGDPDGQYSPFGQEVYQPQPMPDDTGQYGVYSDSAYGSDQQSAYGADQQNSFATYGDYGQDPLVDQNAYATQYSYGDGQYAAYSDPYIGTGGGQQQYDQYAQTYDQQQYDYTNGQYVADPYGVAGQPYGDTPAGGVWMPQQRDGEQQGGYQPTWDEQPYPYQQGYNNGDQYRY